jgi:hypothetical protein
MLCTILGVALALVSGEAPEPVSRISARVAREDGSALGKHWIWLIRGEGAPFQVDPDTHKVQNPNGRTDGDGRVTIEVPPGLFESGEPLSLAWEKKAGKKSHFTALHWESGERLRFTLEEAGDAMNLGTLIAPAPRE